MTIKLASTKVDLAAENAGEWIDSMLYPDVAYFVRSPENRDYRDAREKTIRALAKDYRGKTPPDSLMAEQQAVLFTDKIISDWKGFDEPFERGKAAATLSDLAHRDLMRDIEACAMRVGKRSLEFVEDAGKNSEASSVTS